MLRTVRCAFPMAFMFVGEYSVFELMGSSALATRSYVVSLIFLVAFRAS